MTPRRARKVRMYRAQLRTMFARVVTSSGESWLAAMTRAINEVFTTVRVQKPEPSGLPLFTCPHCQWIGLVGEMTAGLRACSDDMVFCQTICPSCESWLYLDDYECQEFATEEERETYWQQRIK